MNFSGWYSENNYVALVVKIDMQRRILFFIMLGGLVVGSTVQGAETSCTDTTAPGTTKALVEKAREQARELAKTMTIPENRHSERGKKAAEAANAVFLSKEFQEKVQGYENWEELVPRAKKVKKEQEKGILADSEKVYLFLSSSIPEASFQAYMTYLDGVPEIVPVMRGMVGGMDKQNKKERIKWFSRVLTKDTTCQDKPEARCDRLKIPITIKPKLFYQYEITEVPTLVYIRGDEIFQIQGDVGLNPLLERVNQEAKSPGLTNLIAMIRGSR